MSVMVILTVLGRMNGWMSEWLRVLVSVTVVLFDLGAMSERASE